MKSKGARIYYSLLALCYLEIVLWTFCLLTSGLSADADGHRYLARETGNLKTFAGGKDQQNAPHFDELLLSLSELHHQLEQEQLQLVYNAQSVIAASLLHQPVPQSLRAFPALQGLPAPYTGIKAID